MPPAVMVAVHGHPLLNAGGSEVAAGALAHALRSAGGQSWLLGCASPVAGPWSGPRIRQPFEDASHHLYQPGPFDYFRLANRDPAFPAEFAALLQATRPDVLHLHHVLGFGVEAAAVARRALPGLAIVLTLHDYMLACHHDGQMVTRPSLSLCTRADAPSCGRCFPEISGADFFIRAAYLRRFLSEVDLFLAPSAFLAARLSASGLPGGPVSVVPNLLPATPDGSGIGVPVLRPGPLRVGFFGQVSPLKGVVVLLDAASILADPALASFTVHGAGPVAPSAEEAALVRRLASPPPNVCVRGAYRRESVRSLMRACDAVIVPSVWWENAPTVIAEALSAGVPVLCSGIGGMAEMVQDGVDGYHFDVGDAPALAALVRAVAADRSLLSSLRPGARGGAEPFASHLSAYRAAMSAAASR